jgi:hypothetical protein
MRKTFRGLANATKISRTDYDGPLLCGTRGVALPRWQHRGRLKRQTRSRGNFSLSEWPNGSETDSIALRRGRLIHNAPSDLCARVTKISPADDRLASLGIDRCRPLRHIAGHVINAVNTSVQRIRAWFRPFFGNVSLINICCSFSFLRSPRKSPAVGSTSGLFPFLFGR